MLQPCVSGSGKEPTQAWHKHQQEGSWRCACLSQCLVLPCPYIKRVCEEHLETLEEEAAETVLEHRLILCWTQLELPPSQEQAPFWLWGAPPRLHDLGRNLTAIERPLLLLNAAAWPLALPESSCVLVPNPPPPGMFCPGLVLGHGQLCLILACRLYLSPPPSTWSNPAAPPSPP